VDSGSSDDTIDVLRGFGAKVVTIDPKDFNHGLTRNLAAREARGELLVFLNGRSRPTSEKWLGPLLAAFDGDPSVVGVCSRTLPYHDANVLVKAEGTHELSGALTQEQKRIDDWDAYRSMTHAARRAFLNFHTVSAVIRADIFATIPFRSVRTIGEDLLWAREVLEEGWTLVHEPASCVYHSHPYTIKEIFCRNVDDGVANRDIVGRVLDEHDLRPLVDTLVSRDWEVLRATQDLDTSELDWWLREAFFRRIAQVVGQWVGVNYQELPQGMATYFSRIGHQRQLSDQARKDV
ncbi:MAG TPA: glycosyltransferase family 2 protein, partial [Solirubrobacteraceae bacterium]|nr:glycosyltransferase family 2 protein [Solirubrobacteraceae bacterium]